MIALYNMVCLKSDYTDYNYDSFIQDGLCLKSDSTDYDYDSFL